MTTATKEFYTVREAIAWLAKNGVVWHEVYLRGKLGGKHPDVKSEKRFNSRLIPTTELHRIVREHKAA